LPPAGARVAATVARRDAGAAIEQNVVARARERGRPQAVPGGREGHEVCWAADLLVPL
jgi:hypothetical protein